MKKILHVDNEEDTRGLVKKILVKAGYKLLSASSGRECLELVPLERPDLILLDVMMPDMSGWDVLQKIRKRGNYEKVAFLSVIEVSQERKKKLMEEGLSGYILKPFTSEQLVEEVKAIIGQPE